MKNWRVKTEKLYQYDKFLKKGYENELLSLRNQSDGQKDFKIKLEVKKY